MRNFSKNSAVRKFDQETQTVIYIKRPRNRKPLFIALFAIFISFVLIPASILSYYGYQVLALRDKIPEITSIMQYRIQQNADSKKDYEIVRTYVPLSKISKNLINAVIISEDDKFYEHEGFDWDEIAEAWLKNKTKGKIIRGGSTISQQLVKNLFLSPERSKWRKVREAALTYLVERLLDKHRILEIYLNVVEWGDGVFGAEAASQKYYRKAATRLGISQAIRLASTLPNPIRYSPHTTWSQRMQEKRTFITERMKERGLISDSLYQELIVSFIIE